MDSAPLPVAEMHSETSMDDIERKTFYTLLNKTLMGIPAGIVYADRRVPLVFHSQPARLLVLRSARGGT